MQRAVSCAIRAARIGRDQSRKEAARQATENALICPVKELDQGKIRNIRPCCALKKRLSWRGNGVMRAPDQGPRPRDQAWIVLAAMVAFAVFAGCVLAWSLLTVR